jgi:Domain of unknown function (DUF3425)
MSGNRKRARLASLESQVKEQPIQPTQDTYAWHEIQIQSQPLESSPYDAQFPTGDFQSPIPAASSKYGAMSSQSMLYDPCSFDASSSFSTPDLSTDLAQSLPTTTTSTALHLQPLESQPELIQGNSQNHDQTLQSQDDFTGYMTSSDTSYTENNSTFNPILGRAWDSVPPEDTNFDPFSFSDEAYVTTPGLSVVRAHVTILQRMHRNCSKVDVWNPFAVSPFYQPNAPSASPPPLAFVLPENYHPTALQKAVKHHPVLDLLPWPSVRSKILHILTLPQEVRPQRAKGDMASVTMQLMFDMKDAGGGLRVWGSNPFDENNWEVGPVFFQQWWWALNSEIVKRSNQIRTQRGEDILRLRDISH